MVNSTKSSKAEAQGSEQNKTKYQADHRVKIQTTDIFQSEAKHI